MEQTQRKVTIIEPTIDLSIATQKERKLKVCAYARVSTDFEEQKNSFDFQLKEYESQITSNPNWEFIGLYSDEGISGTSLKNRDGFRKMIEDAKAGKINLILTKSISRFARNTADCINYTRQLKAVNVDVYFEKENLHSVDEKTELILGILSSMAQEESRSISSNVKWGIQKRMERNEFKSSVAGMIGLKKDEQGNIVIDETNSYVIKEIYNLFIGGLTLREIGLFLEESHIKTPRGNDEWSISTIENILKNEKYCGDLAMQKTYVKDYITHKAVKNNGEVTSYYVENHHEGIVSKEIFNLTQKLLEEREGFENLKKPTFVFYKLLYCGTCNRPMIKITTHPYTAQERNFLTCKVNKEKKCDSKPVDFNLAVGVVSKVIKQLLNMKPIHSVILDSINDVSIYQNKIDILEKQNIKYKSDCDSLIENQIKAGINQNIKLYEETYKSITDKIAENDEEIKRLENLKIKSIKNEILLSKVEEFLKDSTALNYNIVHYFISKIIINPNNKMDIYLRNKKMYEQLIEKDFIFSNEKGSISATVKEAIDD